MNKPEAMALAMDDRKKKKRKLEKSGLRHVAGWVDEDDKPKVDEMIDAQRGKVEEALKDD